MTICNPCDLPRLHWWENYRGKPRYAHCKRCGASYIAGFDPLSIDIKRVWLRRPTVVENTVNGMMRFLSADSSVSVAYVKGDYIITETEDGAKIKLKPDPEKNLETD